MNLNRIVALLTPLVFAPLAGAVAAWLAEHFPGIDVDQGDLQQIFIAGALIALAPAAQWLHGWQKHEARQAELERDLALASVAAPAALPADELAGDVEEDDFDPADEFAGEEEEFDSQDAFAQDDGGQDELDALDALDPSDDFDDDLDEMTEIEALGDEDSLDGDELVPEEV